MKSFADLPHVRRLQLRSVIHDAGGCVEGYDGPYVLVAIPRPSSPFFSAMEAAGLALDEPSLHLFPLGSDAPAEHLRHPCSKYGPGLSFWLFGRFSPKDDGHGGV